jgi:hypothetical protein
MRWHETLPNTRRTVSRFLWAPLTINGETRWLERASWDEVWQYYYAGYYWAKQVWV